MRHTAGSPKMKLPHPSCLQDQILKSRKVADPTIRNLNQSDARFLARCSLSGVGILLPCDLRCLEYIFEMLFALIFDAEAQLGYKQINFETLPAIGQKNEILNNSAVKNESGEE